MLELLEGGVPEFEVQDLALAGQEVVLDVEAQHGFKMAAQDGGGDEVGDFGGFVAAVLDGVQRVEAQLLARGLFFGGSFGVPLRGARVEVPAVVVDCASVGLRLAARVRNRRGARELRRADFSSRCRKPTTTSATWTPVLSM